MLRQIINKKIITKDLKIWDNLLIKNVQIPEKSDSKEYRADILIEKGVIKSAEGAVSTEGIEFDYPAFAGIKVENRHFLRLSRNGNLAVINADCLAASPSFTDMHVHLREPGDEEEEDIESGINAAHSGGITSMCCMPNTKPSVDSPHIVSYIKMKAEKSGYSLHPAAAMTRGLKGSEITDFGILKDSGAVAFSDDGKCVQDSKLMCEIMKYAKYVDTPLILHEEDYSFSASGCMHEGYYSAKLGLDGISALSEETIIARDIMLAKKTGAKIHITHVSSKNSVEMIKNAKDAGINITCDVTPHHIFFNDSSLQNYNTNLKVSPPIRSLSDQQALISGLKTKIIDAVASDHAPHLDLEKNTTFARAANGTLGLETLFKASYTKLCIEEGFSLQHLLELISINPCSIIGQKKQKIAPGCNADIVLIDTKKQEIFDGKHMFSKSRNSAFNGIKLYGKIVCTIKNGKIVFLDY
jgi:dihydroorotase